MRLYVASSITGIACFILGFAVARIFFHADRLELLSESVLLEVAAPECNEWDGSHAALDGVWQRKIANIIFDLSDNSVFNRALDDLDVKSTEWFQSLSDSERLDKFRASFRVQSVPETSYIALTFDAARLDAPIIANAVARTYLSALQRRAKEIHNASLRGMTDESRRLFMQEEDLRLEADGITEPWVLEERQMELRRLVERRVELKLEIERVQAAFDAEDRTPVRLVKYALTPNC